MTILSLSINNTHFPTYSNTYSYIFQPISNTMDTSAISSQHIFLLIITHLSPPPPRPLTITTTTTTTTTTTMAFSSTLPPLLLSLTLLLFHLPSPTSSQSAPAGPINITAILVQGGQYTSIPDPSTSPPSSSFSPPPDLEHWFHHIDLEDGFHPFDLECRYHPTIWTTENRDRLETIDLIGRFQSTFQIDLETENRLKKDGGSVRLYLRSRRRECESIRPEKVATVGGGWCKLLEAMKRKTWNRELEGQMWKKLALNHMASP